MWGPRSVDPARDALLASAALVAGVLVFTESFEALPAAVAAYAGWVRRLERSAPDRREETRPR